MADEVKKDETIVGTVMKNGGGATAGVLGGYGVGTVIGGILAPFTGGVSLAVAPWLFGAVGGVWGHNKSQDIK